MERGVAVGDGGGCGDVYRSTSTTLHSSSIFQPSTSRSLLLLGDYFEIDREANKIERKK